MPSHPHRISAARMPPPTGSAIRAGAPSLACRIRRRCVEAAGTLTSELAPPRQKSVQKMGGAKHCELWAHQFWKKNVVFLKNFKIWSENICLWTEASCEHDVFADLVRGVHRFGRTVLQRSPMVVQNALRNVVIHHQKMDTKLAKLTLLFCCLVKTLIKVVFCKILYVSSSIPSHRVVVGVQQHEEQIEARHDRGGEGDVVAQRLRFVVFATDRVGGSQNGAARIQCGLIAKWLCV